MIGKAHLIVKVFYLLTLTVLLVPLAPPFMTASARGSTGLLTGYGPDVSSQAKTELLPELKKVQEFLKRMGATDSKGQALFKRLEDDYAAKKVKSGEVKDAATGGEDNAEVVYDNNLNSNVMTLNKNQFAQITTPDPSQMKNEKIREAHAEGVVNWSLTIFHEYVHMNQQNPQGTPYYENEAWQRTIQANVSWFNTMKDREFEEIRQSASSDQKIERLQELDTWAWKISSALITDYQEGIPNAVKDGYLDRDLTWAGLGGLQSNDLALLRRTAITQRDNLSKEIQQEIQKTRNALSSAIPPTINISNNASVVPKNLPTPPGTIDSFSGSFKEHGTDSPCDPSVKRPPVEVPAGKLQARIDSDPPVPNVWSNHNWNTGLKINYAKQMGQKYLPAEDIMTLYGEEKDNHLSGSVNIPAPGRVTVIIEAPSGSGEFYGACYKQNYSYKLEMTSVASQTAATSGLVLSSGDRLRTGNGGRAVVGLLPGVNLWVGPDADVGIQLGSGNSGQTLELNKGKLRIKGTGGATSQVQVKVKGKIVKPKGTEFTAEQTDAGGRVAVIEGTVIVADEAGNEIQVAAGQQIQWPGDKITEYDIKKDDGSPVAGIPLRDVILDDATAEPYGESRANFSNNQAGGGWIWEDPGKDVVLQTPEPGTLKVTVPDGNDLWDEAYAAPRLLHKVTGDFDLEGELLLTSKGTDIATAEFLIKSPGSYLGLLAKQFTAEGDLPHYRIIGGGWQRVQGMNKLKILDKDVADCPDAPNTFVKFRMTRRGDIWKTYWSKDGVIWNLSTRKEIQALDTLWAGWVFKRQAYDDMIKEPNIVTLKNVRLTSAAIGSMPVSEWDMVQWAGSATVQGKTMRLSLDGSRLEGVAAHIGQAMYGDFDIAVSFKTDPWTQPRRFGRIQLVARKDADNAAYLNILKDDETTLRYATDMGLNGLWDKYQFKETTDASGKLRIARKNGLVTTYYWSGKDWVQLSKFPQQLNGLVFLRLEVRNAGTAKSPTAFSGDLTIEQLVAAAPPARTPQPSPTPPPAPTVTPAPVAPGPTPTSTRTPTPAPSPASGLAGTTLLAEKRITAPNSTVVVPIRLEKVNNMGSLNFSLRYDPSVLKVVKVDAGDLVGGSLFQANTREAGIIRFGVVAQGAGISGDGPVAHVVFTASGARGSSAQLTMGDLMATNTGGANLNLNLRNGRINMATKLKGDYDGDGKVTVKDSLAALRMSVGELTEDLNLDMNSDGKVTAEDARQIMAAALK